MYALMQDHIDKNQLSIKLDRDDFIWYIQQPGVNCVVHENEQGKIDGFILAWKFLMAGFGKSVPFGWLDLIHIYRLSEAEAIDLCKYFCSVSKDLGWAGLQSPYFPYFNPKPLQKAKWGSPK